jgi:crotonobetainyl-CoA:carnitine CoA-transferase CaiB-like acyl-CoA transferase
MHHPRVAMASRTAAWLERRAMRGLGKGAMLRPYRVLDLTTERGFLCGQMLADLGADVIKVEPPGGSPGRRLAPFFRDVPHPDRSLYFWAYNRNKRGITLDVESPEGRMLFARLVASADFLVESDNPGEMARRGLGYDELAALNPKLVYVSITAFGQDGPKASYADADMVILAAGGPLRLTGDDDRPPLRVGVGQAYLHASAEAAVGALVANHERVRSGRGQHVDVSAQQAVTLATQLNMVCAKVGLLEMHRIAGGARIGPLTARFLWPARDGHVSITFLFGSAFGPFTRRLMEQVERAGFCDAATRDKDWFGYFEKIFSGEETVAEYDRVKDCVAAFTASRTKADLFKLAREHVLLMAPIATTEEIVESEQLATRDYWRTVDHPELDARFRYPGPFARFSATPLAYRRRSPLVGEHNREVLGGELGLDEAALADLARRGVV